jgi:glycosyltransferase involved in cell wall biosynthesis
MKKPVFTIIMDTFYRPELLRHAVEALFRQTYSHLEIILVNNAATPETVEYLREVEAQDSRVKLVHFMENQFSWDDPLKIVNCFNAGLDVATGDYVWYQADDDWIADDYAEKMVRLFEDNPECTTAAGIPVSVDIRGNILDTGPRTTNFRPTYTPGMELALDHLRGGNMFSAPGTIFTIKRDVLLRAGGYHRCAEISQIFGIVPFGTSGFDETALFYWRRHEGQLNKLLSTQGYWDSSDFFNLLREWEIERRWQVFGFEVAREVVTTLQKKHYLSAADWFAVHLGTGNLKASRCLTRKIGGHLGFWREVPRALWRRKSYMVYLKGAVRKLFRFWPGLAELSPRLASLRNRAERQL